jgi:phosphoribosylformylglycinamidine synthase
MTGRSERFIEVHLRPEVRDAAGERVRQQALCHLGIETGVVRTAKLFDVQVDLADEELEIFADCGLKDEVLHEILIGRPHEGPRCASYLLVEKLPGVTDDEGICAQRTLADLLAREVETGVQRIFTSDLYQFERRLSGAELLRLGGELLGNPLVHRFRYGDAFGERGWARGAAEGMGARFEAVDLEVGDSELLALSKARVLSLSLEELRAIRGHFRGEEVVRARAAAGLPRSPTDCELEVLAQTWSEHCKHKEFNALISVVDAATGERSEVDSLFGTFIRGATERVRERLEAGGERWLVKVFTDNAGVVRIDESRLFVFKVETHNSPSALDPYGGAITGILGNNRDPLGTGRGGARLLFNTNVLCFGLPGHEGPLLPGQLHPRRVLAGVRHGIEDGGNKSGIPTVNGAILFDEGFAGKPLVYCGTGGVMADTYAGRASWVKEVDAGDLIVMAGGRVGKDGIHGATFSSAEIGCDSPRSAVQIGSPITQKLLSDFLERACGEGLVKCSTDCGAGGLSSSVGELAELSGGAEVELEKVPLKYAGLRPWEIFVSESQERMTLVVEPEKLAGLIELARRYEVEVTHIGRFTATGKLEVRHEGIPVALLDMEFLHHGVPRKRMEAVVPLPASVESCLPAEVDPGQALLGVLSSLNVCSREAVIRRYDHEVKGRTVVKPLMGMEGTAAQDAAVLRLGFDSWEGVAVSCGICPKYAELDAYASSAAAFDEAVRQLVGVGARLPLHGGGRFWCATDNFCVPDSAYDPAANPDGREKLGRLVEMCRALYDMSTFFAIPLTSGKDSMKNDFVAGGRKISVPPTVLYSMVAGIADVRRCVTSELKRGGDLLYLLGETRDELGGSELYRLSGVPGGNVPRVRKEEALDLYERVMRLHDARLLASCHDLSDGGLAVALAEAAFGRGLGVEVSLPVGMPAWVQLFSESQSRFLVSVRPEDRERFAAVMGDRAECLGRVAGHGRMRVEWGGKVVVEVAVSRLLEAWRRGLEGWL